MSNSKLPSTASALATAITKTKQRIADTADGDFQFIKLEKSGSWVFGADDTLVDDTDLWAVDPNSLMTGYIAWSEDGEPLGEEMASIMSDPVDKNSLENLGVKWSEQIGFGMLCVEGENVGVQVVYKATSLGGRKMFRKLLDVVFARAESGESDLVPLVFLDADFYKHKKYGKIFTPELITEEWTSSTAIAPEGEPEPEPEPEPEALPEPEPEPEAEAPKKTKRTRAKVKAEAEPDEESLPKKRKRRTRAK